MGMGMGPGMFPPYGFPQNYPMDMYMQNMSYMNPNFQYRPQRPDQRGPSKGYNNYRERPQKGPKAPPIVSKSS